MYIYINISSPYSCFEPVSAFWPGGHRGHLVTWSGDGAPVNKKKAFQYYLAAARAGVSRAMNNLGYMLRVGDGVEENKEEALEWYLKGARAGDMDAQYHLGEPRPFVTLRSFTWECSSAK